MANILDAYVGFKDEVTYGTAVAVDKFYKGVTNVTFNGKYESPIVAEGIMTGYWGVDETMFEPNPKGAGGDIELLVQKRGSTFLLRHMFGSETLDVSATQDIYNHTYALGDKFGKSFTCQINKPSAGTTPADNIYTFEGGKIADWELSNSVDGFLMLKATCDFEKETIGAGAGAYAKQTFTSIANNAPFSYRGASITFNGTGVKAKDISIKVSQGLDTERFFIANGGNKYEPLQSERPNIEVELKAEYESNALASTSAATLAASKIVPVVATWNSPSAETAGGTASLVITFSYLRVDDVTNALGANGLIEQTIKGVAMGQSPMTAALNTPEAS